MATVQVQDAVVRAGPNDNVYNAIATLPLGTKVVVKGISESGAWVQVGISFNEVDFSYYGVSGWMRDYLFKDADGNIRPEYEHPLGDRITPAAARRPLG